MFLHRYLNVEIAGRRALLARFAFAAETNAIAGIDACGNFHRQGFRFLDASMTMAGVARIFNHRAAAVTGRTGLLHGKEALTHLHLACAVAGRTGLRLRTRLRAAAVADVALLQRRDADLFGHAAHRFFQRQLHVVA